MTEFRAAAAMGRRRRGRALVAKDGFEVRPSARRLRTARQVVSIGETYDFEYTSTSRGAMRLEVWSSEVPDLPLRPRLLVSVPIRVQ